MTERTLEDGSAPGGEAGEATMGEATVGEATVGEATLKEIEALRREVERLLVITSADAGGVLDTVLHHSPHGIIVCDAAGRLTLHNRAAERIWAGSATTDSLSDWSKYRAFHADGRPYAPEDWSMIRCLRASEVISAEEVWIQRFDGVRALLLGSCAPIFGPAGEVRGALSVFADVTEFHQLAAAERMARSQAEASHFEMSLLFRLSDAVNRADTLADVYEPALEAVISALRVDRASVLLLDPDSVMRFKAHRHLSDEYRAAVEGHSPWSPDEADPKPVLVSDVLADEAYAPYHELFRREGIRSLGFIPLVHRRRLLGKFMVYDAAPRVFTLREVELAQTIASQISQAVTRSRLLEGERLARADAERATARVRRIQRVTESLSEAATSAEVAQVIVTQGVAATGAATGGLWLLGSGGVAELVHAQGYSDPGRQDFSRIDLCGPLETPVADAFQKNECIWIRSKREFGALYPKLAAVVAPRPEYRSACLPVRSADRCVAVLAFTFDKEGDFDDAEREFLQNIAKQGGLALERSQLLTVEREARARAEAAHRRASFKAEASALLGSSLDYETTLKHVAKLAVPKFADWCAVELGEAPGHSTLVAVEHIDPAKVALAWQLRERYPPDPAAPHGVPQVLRTGKAELYREVTDEILEKSTIDPERIALGRALGLRSAINAPIAIQGRTIGVITFIWAESGKRYDEADLETAILLGQRAALAIENSRLHRRMQRAVKAREDLLAVVSHDLRNPLGVVLMRAASIARNLPGDGAAAKARKHAVDIQSAAQRMADLISDLLDLGSIEAGELKLQLSAEDLGALLSSAADEIQPLAASKGVRIDVSLPPQTWSVRCRCDRRRVSQVLSNLLGNAVKFTPSGGSIHLRSSIEGGMAKIVVLDTGQGVDPAHLSQIFERYYQAPTRERSGVGLGLFIAKGIVTAHGGQIWAESTPGEGSSFYFTLPLAEGDEAESVRPAWSAADRPS